VVPIITYKKKKVAITSIKKQDVKLYWGAEIAIAVGGEPAGLPAGFT
jgi:hypothetical protein